MNNLPFLIRNLPKNKRNEYYQNNNIISLNKENLSLREEINELKFLVEFYQSIWKTHYNSVIYNLKIKYKKGEPVWIDKIKCDRNELLELDQDNEIIEWLKPVKCER
jgi:argininosuccinate synthase